MLNSNVTIAVFRSKGVCDVPDGGMTKNTLKLHIIMVGQKNMSLYPESVTVMTFRFERLDLLEPRMDDGQTVSRTASVSAENMAKNNPKKSGCKKRGDLWQKAQRKCLKLEIS